MKTSTLAIALLSLLPTALAAESAGPSPTESYGCEPHGDHYHCDGLRATLITSITEDAAAATTTEAHEHEHENEHDHSVGTVSPGPSPTESYGCEPHGDHYHCEGSRATLTSVVSSSSSAAASAATATSTHDHEGEDGETASAGPSPTESYGCEPHGDHWHCEGSRTETKAGSDSTPTASSTLTEDLTTTPTNAAGMEMVPVLGLVAAAILVL